MSQKKPRLILLAAALVAAILVVWKAAPSKPATTPPAPQAPDGADEDGGGETFGPLDRTTGPPTAPGGAVDPLSIDADVATLRRDVGPSLSPGRDVSLLVPYRAGAEAQYEIERTMVQEDRSTQQAVAKQDLYGVTVRVVEGDGTGSARVRLTVDWMGLKAIYPGGFQYEFDTRRPDDRVLAHPNAGFEVQPQLVIVGIPIEFVLDASGTPTGVDGADRWAEAWEEGVERMQPGSSRKLPNPYSDDRVILTWSTWLFPPTGGGTLVTGQTREIELLEDYGNAYFVSHVGPLRATHDDGDVFRVRLLTKAGLRQRQGAARTPSESAVAKVHVQGDADSVHAAWRFDRKSGLLQDAEIDARFQMWTSYRVGSGSETGAAPEIVNGLSSDYEPVFLSISHRTTVERTAEPK